MDEDRLSEAALINIVPLTIPLKNPEVTIREEMEDDGKHILFNGENELILVTNATGKFILDKCDGEKNVGQIIAAIENHFSVDGEIDLDEVVKGYLQTLYNAKLIKINTGKK